MTFFGGESNIIDTFPAFLSVWGDVQHMPVDAQLDAWASDYMSHWPELLEKQVNDYTDQGLDWRQIAREKVFPFLGPRLPAMATARENLLELCGPLHSRARQVLAFEGDLVFVIYVGIGCGAGWVTDFMHTPAVLFGLENIAECGWIQPPALTGMIAHEIGHILHFHWREAHAVPEATGPWWQLYTEGFAQRCEHLILGQETWHMRIESKGDDWLEWCQAQQSWLAREFIRRAGTGESVRPFFGSWYDICGRKQCGYFLGHELVKQLETVMELQQVALLAADAAEIERELERLAEWDT